MNFGTPLPLWSPVLVGFLKGSITSDQTQGLESCLAPGKFRQEDSELKTSLGYIFKDIQDRLHYVNITYRRLVLSTATPSRGNIPTAFLEPIHEDQAGLKVTEI